MITEKQWTTELVRVCEREPDRIGLYFRFCEGDPRRPGNMCIWGQVNFNLAGYAGPLNGVADHQQNEIHHWGARASMLNNQGVRWGEIPKRLGLVPGEAPAETPETMVPEEVTA